MKLEIEMSEQEMKRIEAGANFCGMSVQDLVRDCVSGRVEDMEKFKAAGATSLDDRLRGKSPKTTPAQANSPCLHTATT